MRATLMELGRCTRDRFVDVTADGSEARLAPSFLVTHEMGVRSGIEEEITDQWWARVTFDLPKGKPAGAVLLWYVGWVKKGDKRPMHVAVNGHLIRHEMAFEELLTGGWDRHEIPARRLRPGRNEIVFRDCGRLQVDPGPTTASARSFDGGRTWHTDAMGPKHSLLGDYMVRLRVKGHPPSGQVTSPVIDLGDPDDVGRIAPVGRFTSARVVAKARLPKGTRVAFEMRSGPSPAFHPTCWTPWQRGKRLSEPGRFVQWRATLATTRTEATPLLTDVAVEATGEGDEAGTAAVEVVRWDRPTLERSSYPFTYLAPHPRAERLVRQYRLDRVVAAGKTELERLCLLREWVHRQWYGWQRDRYPYCPPWDPLEILETVKGNWGYGMCTHYASTFVGCAAALGYVARVVVIDHHCLVEAWINELGKWILMDPGPDRRFNAMYELDGKPASALEVHEAVRRGDVGRLRERRFPEDKVRPMRKKIADIFCRFGIPLRNNYLAQPEPAEHQHGQDQYHWDGYLWWTDAADPKYAEYSLQTRRAADFYWTVGKVRIYLDATDTPRRLLARFEHAMPNFDHFLVRSGTADWARSDAVYAWSLGEGDNVLAVKAVNVFGHAGRASSVTVRATAKASTPSRRVPGRWPPAGPDA